MEQKRPHPLRVAINGIDGAGKTMFADELAEILQGAGCSPIRASGDNFANPRSVRYQRGRDSPEGYYFDSFDNQALIRELLMPLGPGGDRRYRTASREHATDQPIDGPVAISPEDAIVLVDGIFLLRPELNSYWDFKIFLRAEFGEALTRAVVRDQGRFGFSRDEIEYRYRHRYLPGQRIYLDAVHPEDLADVVIENSDIHSPRFLKGVG